PATPPLSTLSLHDALPIYHVQCKSFVRENQINPIFHPVRGHKFEYEGALFPKPRFDVGRLGLQVRDEKTLNFRQSLCRRKNVQRSEEHTSELQSRFDLVCR